MRRLLRFMLKGHEVVEARFGLDALRVQDRGPFGLVICDVSLTDMDGQELYEALINDGYVGPMLFLAARLDITPRDRFGARLPVLYKPVDAEVLSERVASLIEAGRTCWDAK